MKQFSAHQKDLGDGFTVKRILPHLDARSVGPFVFIDHFGPVPVKTGKELVVRPHPHIGLATVTYLYDGLILHKDSLGTEQLIRPGEVNWMTAGRGIVHSEHSRLDGQKQIEGIQIWVALPREHEEVAPAFDHYAAALLPTIELPGATVRLIAGAGFGEKSPVKTFSAMCYWDIEMRANTSIRLAIDPHFQNGLYVARGDLRISNQTISTGQMAIFAGESEIVLASTTGARAVFVGGEALAEPRHLWWNFVSTSKVRIEQAKIDWRENNMGIVAGESDRIPLPE